MYKLSKNSPLPKEYIEQISSPADNYAMAITGTPIEVFLVLSGVMESEKELFYKDMTIGAAIIENIPFLVIDFGHGLSFDIVIESMQELEDPDYNAINIHLVEKNGFIIREMRIVGAKKEIIATLQNGIKSMPDSVKANIGLFVNQIYGKYSTSDILLKCKTQKFTKK